MILYLWDTDIILLMFEECIQTHFLSVMKFN